MQIIGKEYANYMQINMQNMQNMQTNMQQNMHKIWHKICNKYAEYAKKICKTCQIKKHFKFIPKYAKYAKKICKICKSKFNMQNMHSPLCWWAQVVAELSLRLGSLRLRAVNVWICRWLLDIWQQDVCITQHFLKSCKAGLRSESSYVQVHTQLVHTRSTVTVAHTRTTIACTSTYSESVQLCPWLCPWYYKYIASTYLYKWVRAGTYSVQLCPQTATSQWRCSPATQSTSHSIMSQAISKWIYNNTCAYLVWPVLLWYELCYSISYSGIVSFKFRLVLLCCCTYMCWIVEVTFSHPAFTHFAIWGSEGGSGYTLAYSGCVSIICSLNQCSRPIQHSLHDGLFQVPNIEVGLHPNTTSVGYFSPFLSMQSCNSLATVLAFGIPSAGPLVAW